MQESCSPKLPACRLACTLIIIIVAYVVNVASSTATSIGNHDSIDRIIGEPCGDRTRCDWNIPPDPDTGCCPRESGQACYPDSHERCNWEFGLKCMDGSNSSLASDGVGICRGPYNLTATTVTQKQVTLEWTHFAPEDYPFEYALLMRQGTYHRDIGQWTVRDCGPEPRCVMRRLSPGSTYLVKMAVWEDIRSSKFGTTTETIVVTTQAVDQCLGDTEGVQYFVGESFIHEQKENCTCLPTGEFQCHLLCPNGVPEVEEGCEIILSEGCRYNISCNFPEGYEENEEELCYRYPDGTELRFDCRVCRCEDGNLKCSYTEVCSVLSPKPACENIKEIKIPGQCCPEWDCEDVCQHENKSYSSGELFESESCGLCQCQPSGSVECVSDCPPVEMVPMSLACPNPHIKRSGCCDTLHCFQAVSDLFSYVRNLVVLYTTSTSLTLAFEAEPICEIDGFPSYCYYRIQYANTSTPLKSHGWKNRIVHPVAVVHDDLTSSYSHPIDDVFNKDTAIVINRRAVVTVTGMDPSTEFYVVVTREEQVREDMTEMDNNLGLNSLAAKVVVKTRPLQNVTSCFYSGRVVLHGEIVSRLCNQVCVCNLGQIVCRSTCSDEQIVIAASVSCPRPRLEKKAEECCPTWHCNPSVSGCQYKNAVLRPGQEISDGCQECVCNNATIRCVSLCPPSGTAPRNGCVLTNRSGHCCPQWSCPLEKSTPVAVESSVLLKFMGSCQNPVSSFKKSLAKEIVAHVSKLMNCSDTTHSPRVCEGLSAAVECSPNVYQEGDRKRRAVDEDRSAEYIGVLVSVRRNFSSDTDQAIVFKEGQDLQKLLNSSFSVRLPSGHSLQSTDGTRLRRPVYICGHGFSYRNQQCVLSEIDIIGSQWTHIAVTPVDISPRSVTFQWSPLSDTIQKHIATLHIKYRQTGQMSWASTKSLPPWRTTITLSGLEPGTSFVGSLVAVRRDDVRDDGTLDDGGADPWWIVGDTSFQTLASAEDEALSSIDLTQVSVTANLIVLYWGRLTQEFWTQVEVASILYWMSSSNVIHKIRIENNGFPFIKIEGLSPSTEYTSQMTVVLSNGRTFRSQTVRISTLPTEQCDHSLLLPILIACPAVVVLLGLVIFMVLMCRRSQRKNKNPGIENKVYGVSLGNGTAVPENTNTGGSSPS